MSNSGPCQFYLCVMNKVLWMGTSMIHCEEDTSVVRKSWCAWWTNQFFSKNVCNVCTRASCRKKGAFVYWLLSRYRWVVSWFQQNVHDKNWFKLTFNFIFRTNDQEQITWCVMCYSEWRNFTGDIVWCISPKKNHGLLKNLVMHKTRRQLWNWAKTPKIDGSVLNHQ